MYTFDVNFSNKIPRFMKSNTLYICTCLSQQKLDTKSKNHIPVKSTYLSAITLPLCKYKQLRRAPIFASNRISL